MSFFADYKTDFETWDYIHGDYYQGMSIAVDRYYYLLGIEEEHGLKISLRDPSSDHWTKWVGFPGLLLESKRDSYGGTAYVGLTSAIDVHRSVLKNKIVIESD